MRAATIPHTTTQQPTETDSEEMAAWSSLKPPRPLIGKRHRGHADVHVRHQAIRLRQEGLGWSAVKQITGFGETAMRSWIAYHERTGLVKEVKLPRTGPNALSEAAQAELVRALQEDCELYYDELQHIVFLRTGEVASLSTVRRVAVAAGFRVVATSPVMVCRNPRAMRLHAELRALYHWSCFIFVDEAHRRGDELRRKYGKAQGNRRAHTSQLPENLSRSWTVIAAMNFTGLVAHKIVELSRERPAIDREAWMAYFEAFILPHLGNAARGEPNSVIVIDNAVRSATTCAARAPVRNAAQTAADCAAAYRASTGAARCRTAR